MLQHNSLHQLVAADAIGAEGLDVGQLVGAAAAHALHLRGFCDTPEANIPTSYDPSLDAVVNRLQHQEGRCEALCRDSRELTAALAEADMSNSAAQHAARHALSALELARVQHGQTSADLERLRAVEAARAAAAEERATAAAAHAAAV
jgi:hypothetical protein